MEEFEEYSVYYVYNVKKDSQKPLPYFYRRLKYSPTHKLSKTDKSIEREIVHTGSKKDCEKFIETMTLFAEVLEEALEKEKVEKRAN